MMTTYEDTVMVNQINNLSNNKVVNNAEPQDKNQIEQSDNSNTKPDNDRVNLSDTAKSIETIQALIEGAPEIDTEKVKAVKNELENGTLEINSDAIAKKIIEELGA
jgi:negative regulator of flagellin synthesis FlgM